MELRLSLSGESPNESELTALAGVGLLRGEFILRDLEKDISQPSCQRALQTYLEELSIAFSPKPVGYRFIDL